MRTWMGPACALMALGILTACGDTGGSGSGGGGASSSSSTGDTSTASTSSTGTSSSSTSSSSTSTSSSSGSGGAASSSSSTGSSSSSSGSGGGSMASANKIDLVLSIDNSRSMADKQAVLKLAVSGIVAELVNPLCRDANDVPVAPQPATPNDPCPAGSTREFTPVGDMHIGVVTSSLGGHGADACPVQGDPVCGNGMNPSANTMGHLVATLDACTGAAAPTYQNLGFLAWDPAHVLNPPGESSAAQLATTFGNMVVGVGQVGCGFESQLEGWYRFLVDPDPYQSISVVNGKATPTGTDNVLLQQRVDFLRPDSLLAIMMLTDEDDCSTKEYGQFFYANQIMNPGNPGMPFHLPRARAECALNPNDACCLSCGQSPGNCAPDQGCLSNPTLSAQEDNVALRCWDQKRRFGIDFLYPVDRYVQGLTAMTVSDRFGAIVPNPIYSDLNPNDNLPATRTPDLVFLLGIVGVPWQDIAVDPKDLTKGYKDSTALGMQVNGKTGWDVILGDPQTYTPPADPLMIESIAPRAGVNPVTGDPVAPANQPLKNPINGNEYSIPANDDLQYACIFTLTTPKDCSAPGVIACDCTNGNNDSPLCASDPNNGGKRTLQVRAKAYPGQRHINVLKQLGAQGVVASICPSQTADGSKADFAYLPAARALIDRMRPRLQ